MSQSIELIHITDLHLLADPDAQLHGWRVDPAFNAVLDDARLRYPRADAYVLGGDLVDDESVAGYTRLNRRLATLDRPVLAMAGNHDDPARMAASLTHADVHQRRLLGGWQLIALNSHVPGSAAGRLGARQLQWLDTRLVECDAPTLLFVHHPPCDVGSAWIDAIGLADRDALQAVVRRRRQVRGLICGHAHQEAALTFAERPCLITPATMRQFAPHASCFATDERSAPGYRHLLLRDDGRIETAIHRVEQARRACG